MQPPRARAGVLHAGLSVGAGPREGWLLTASLRSNGMGGKLHCPPPPRPGTAKETTGGTPAPKGKGLRRASCCLLKADALSDRLDRPLPTFLGVLHGLLDGDLGFDDLGGEDVPLELLPHHFVLGVLQTGQERRRRQDGIDDIIEMFVDEAKAEGWPAFLYAGDTTRVCACSAAMAASSGAGRLIA